VAKCTTLKETTEYDLEILDFLIQQGLDVIQDDDIAWPVLFRWGCKLPVITHLVGLGLNPNARATWRPFDLLQSVIQNTKPDDDAVCAEFVQRSIEMSADINVVDYRGVGLLHLAASRQCASWLLRALKLIRESCLSSRPSERVKRKPLKSSSRRARTLQPPITISTDTSSTTRSAAATRNTSD
jgi:hypothetical protein